MPDESAILTELRDNFTYAQDYWRDVYAEGAKDVRYQTEGPWEADDLKERGNRITLWLDELSQYTNQIKNEFRQAKRSVKLNPKGQGADEQTALKRAAMIREIEYDSNALHAYISAGESMVDRSYGFFKLSTDWEPGTMLRKIIVAPIPNPDCILLDPDFKKPDASDCEWGFEIEEGMRERAFRKQWPKADTTGFDDVMAGAAKGWVSGTSETGYKIRVASYWKREARPKKLYLLENGETVESTEKKPLRVWEAVEGGEKRRYAAVPTVGASGEPVEVTLRVVDAREDNEYRVRQYVTNGVEILEENDTDWQEIPIIPMFGPQVWVPTGTTSKRKFFSAVRRARDGQKAYCYARSAMIERLAMDPKTPYEGWKGQFDTNTDWANVNKNPVGYVEFNPVEVASGQFLLDKPSRNLTEPQIGQYETAAESLRRSIQAAMGGSPLPTSAQRQNQKSGVALQQIEQSQDQGNYHFTDNFDRAIERAGRMMDSALDIVYDTPREHGFRSAEDEYSVEPINQMDPATGQPIGFHTKTGDHGVTISVGPSSQSMRDEADKFLNQLASNEAVFPRVADLVVKMKNLGPIGDQIAQRLAPPDAQGLPPEMQQQMQAAQQQIGELQQQLQEAKLQAEIKKYTVDEQEKTKRVLGLAQLDQQEAMQKLESMLGMLSERFDRLHEAHLQAAGQQHEHEMAEAGHERAQEMAAMQPQEETAAAQ